MSEENGIPVGWRPARVGDVLRIRNGFAFKSTDYTDEGVALVRQAELKGRIVDLSDAKRLPASFLDEHYSFVVKRGDLLIGMSGSIGKVARYESDEAALQNQRTGLLVLTGAIEPRFAAMVMRRLESAILLKGKGIAVQNVSSKEIEQESFPLPPLREQGRIADAFDELETDLDAGVAALERAKANLKRYRAAVLKAAVEGKLTAAWRSEHPNIRPAALPVAATAKSATKKRAGRLWGSGMVPPITDDERKRIGNGWCWAKVRQLGSNPDEAVQVGPMSMRSQDFESAGVPVLNVGCVQWDRFEERKLDFMPDEKAAAFDRYRLRRGDVLFTRSGTVGRCAVVEGHQDGWLMTFHLLRVRPNPKLCLSRYLRMVFEGASHVRRQTRDASIGTTRAGFNTNLLADLDVPLPPIEEQTQIVAEVAEKLSQIEAADVAIDHGLARAARLRQSILKRAFAGQLVPQDSHNEQTDGLQ